MEATLGFEEMTLEDKAAHDVSEHALDFLLIETIHTLVQSTVDVEEARLQGELGLDGAACAASEHATTSALLDLVTGDKRDLEPKACERIKNAGYQIGLRVAERQVHHRLPP
ncbi:hypothetical protein EV182_000419 [Spiromyces aspiralis]|uniref:Uncharacterized protein n=1 Tax=Spiromyces aspiralis TaxID=68401 RepID=A0ACC1HKF6_9FUNG|nr:hypothetical protein EV182_000419 [Spiromyces aspiralis]